MSWYIKNRCKNIEKNCKTNLQKSRFGIWNTHICCSFIGQLLQRYIIEHELGTTYTSFNKNKHHFVILFFRLLQKEQLEAANYLLSNLRIDWKTNIFLDKFQEFLSIMSRNKILLSFTSYR